MSTVNQIRQGARPLYVPETLMDYYNYYISLQIGVVDKATIRTYEIRRNNFFQYLVLGGAPDLQPREFSLYTLRDFERWMRADKGWLNDYVVKNMGLLRKILKMALQDGKMNSNPTDLIKCKRKPQQDVPHFRPGQLKILKDHSFDSEATNKQKVLMMFNAYSGLIYIDLKRFKKSKHIIKDEKGRKWIDMRRKKTGVGALLPLLPEAEAALNYFPGDSLPVLSNFQYSKYIKKICRLLKLRFHGTDREPSCKWLRSTFANIMLNDYGVPLKTVSVMLGHTTTKTTERYYVRLSMERIAIDMEPAIIKMMA